LSDMITRPSAVINRLALNRAAIVGCSRFVNNPKIKFHLIMEGHYKHVGRRVQSKDLICAQDTSDFNYEHHRRKIKEGELGYISDGRSLGLRVHPMLVMDADDGFAYGFSDLQVINRKGRENEVHIDHKSLPIEEKESYRWLKSIEETKKRLSGAKSLTIVSDRESDIYQLWSRVLDSSTHLVIRTSFFRKFIDESNKELFSTDDAGYLGPHEIHVPARPGKKDKARKATLEVYVQKGYTCKPKALRAQKGNKDPKKIPLYIVTVREKVPDGMQVEEPIEWILLTDRNVNNLGEAIEIVDIYKMRWNIEQIFRLTKQKGFELEESQLETSHGLENLIALVFIAAIRIFQMVRCRDDQNRQGSDVFEEIEIEALKKLNKGLEGKSERSKNKNKLNTLAYYTWIVARLGNWKPEDKHPPGPITFKRGWETFENYLRLTQLASP
jgi:hypothetical protein